MKLASTRAMINAALDGKLDDVAYVEACVWAGDAGERAGVPTRCAATPDLADPAAYDAQIAKLAKMFAANFGAVRGK
jgi:phosphoenolpyruvate carboxykinase (ATP)